MAKGALHTVGRSSRGAQRDRLAVCVRGHRGRYLGRRISASHLENTYSGARRGGAPPNFGPAPHLLEASATSNGRPSAARTKRVCSFKEREGEDKDRFARTLAAVARCRVTY